MFPNNITEEKKNNIEFVFQPCLRLNIKSYFLVVNKIINFSISTKELVKENLYVTCDNRIIPFL